MALSIAPEEVVHMTYDENKHGSWGAASIFGQAHGAIY
jgi:hypothetical protein